MKRGQTIYTNIELEAETNFKSLFNNDRFKDIFSIKTKVIYEDNLIKTEKITFIDLNNYFLNENRFYLLANSDILEFKTRWKYRPNYLSYDIYGTQSFAPILLFINDVISVLDFDFDYVKAPRLSALKTIIINNQKFYPNKDKIKDIEFL